MVTPDHHDLIALLGLAPSALILLQPDGRVVWLNPAAERFVAHDQILAVKNGLLTARRRDENRTIRTALAKLQAGEPPSLFCLRGREGNPIIVLDMQRLQSGLLAIRLAAMASRSEPPVARLRAVFDFTPAEGRVAVALLGGYGLSGIAAQHGVEAETVRTQVKRMRSKAGARSQLHLLAILAAAAADAPPV